MKKIISKIFFALVLLITIPVNAAQHDFVLPDNKGGEIWADVYQSIRALASQNSGPNDPAQPQVLDPIFTGSGLDDATSGGTFANTTKTILYLRIDTIGATDTFEWRKNSGAWTSNVPITGAAQTLIDGITVTFAATTGHTVDDKWFIIGLPGNTIPFQFWGDTSSGVLKQRNPANTAWLHVRDLQDNNPPVITLNGNPVVNINQGTTYVDAGATAFDDLQGDLTGDIVTTGLPILTTNPSTGNIVTYNVSDAAGNAADPVTRTVNVLDIIPPVITLTGDSVVNVNKGTTYVDAGATAADTSDGDLTSSIVINGLPIVTAVASTGNTITYNVSDAAGNAATEVTRTVNVLPVCASGNLTFNAPGTNHVFTVPVDCNTVSFTVKGAGGGNGGNNAGNRSPGNGGAGGRVTGSIAVTPGEFLTIEVGAGGSAGADDMRVSVDGEHSTAHGGNGGGKSAILRGSTYLVVAGGGGGGGGEVGYGNGHLAVGKAGAGAGSTASGSPGTGGTGGGTGGAGGSGTVPAGATNTVGGGAPTGTNGQVVLSWGP